MEKYINEHKKECWKGVTEYSEFSKSLFHQVPDSKIEHLIDFYEPDLQFAFHSDLGSLTVLDRMTGFGWRDIESGYRDEDGKFWLASGNYDVRDSDAKTVGEAIEWVKQRSNTCVPA